MRERLGKHNWRNVWNGCALICGWNRSTAVDSGQHKHNGKTLAPSYHLPVRVNVLSCTFTGPEIRTGIVEYGWTLPWSSGLKNVIRSFQVISRGYIFSRTRSLGCIGHYFLRLTVWPVQASSLRKVSTYWLVRGRYVNGVGRGRDLVSTLLVVHLHSNNIIITSSMVSGVHQVLLRISDVIETQCGREVC